LTPRASGRSRGFAEAAPSWPAATPRACLADACALIVFHGLGGAGMSATGLEAMRGGEVLVTALTVWEITRKAGDGRLPHLPVAADGSFVTLLRQSGYKPFPLDWDIAARAATLPLHHRDPMDRILIATALAAGLPIVTNDAAFAAYGVPTLW
jgi:PIN domain nuclease of toxin-antitoxin system